MFHTSLNVKKKIEPVASDICKSNAIEVHNSHEFSECQNDRIITEMMQDCNLKTDSLFLSFPERASNVSRVFCLLFATLFVTLVYMVKLNSAESGTAGWNCLQEEFMCQDYLKVPATKCNNCIATYVLKGGKGNIYGAQVNYRKQRKKGPKMECIGHVCRMCVLTINMMDGLKFIILVIYVFYSRTQMF